MSAGPARFSLVALALLGGLGLPLLLAAWLGDARVFPPAEALQRAQPGFVGSASCAACHAREAAAWHGSDHARAMAAATPAHVLGDFSGVTIIDGRHSATFRREGDDFVIRTDGAGGAIADFVISETFGVDPLQQYLVVMPDGRRQVLPWAWDARPREAGGQRWYHLLPDEALHAGDPLHWTGRDQNWNFMCAACHSTGVVRGYDAARHRHETSWTEISVGCESCHGRGAAHVAWAEAGARAGVAHAALEVPLRDRSGGAWRFVPGDPRGIAQWQGPPRKAGLDNVCASCHARARPILADPVPGTPFLDSHASALLTPGLYHATGQIQGEVFEWGSFQQSRMAQAGVTCGDCHKPHGGKLRAEGNAVCAACHLPARFDTASHHHHPAGTPAAQCTACHMPSVVYMGVDRRHDHAFQVPRPDVSAVIGTPNACGACHTDRPAAWAAQQVRDWFGPQRRDTPHPALAIEAGRRREAGADAALAALARDPQRPGILRATALSLLASPPSGAALPALAAAFRDPDPLVRAAALRALEGVPPRNRAPALSLLADDTRLVRITAAQVLAPLPLGSLPPEARAPFERAWAELLASEQVAAERPEAHVNLARLHAQRGDVVAAQAAYRAALTRDPNFLPALVNMADFERARGQEAAAESLLRRASAAHPYNAEAQFALGLTLVRRARAREALGPLGRAAALSPETPRYAHVLGVALAENGRAGDAAEVWRAALARHPNDRDLLLALAGHERDRLQFDEAERLASRAAALQPGDPQAVALLAQIRALRQRGPGLR